MPTGTAGTSIPTQVSSCEKAKVAHLDTDHGPEASTGRGSSGDWGRAGAGDRAPGQAAAGRRPNQAEPGEKEGRRAPRQRTGLGNPACNLCRTATCQARDVALPHCHLPGQYTGLDRKPYLPPHQSSQQQKLVFHKDSMGDRGPALQGRKGGGSGNNSLTQWTPQNPGRL